MIPLGSRNDVLSILQILLAHLAMGIFGGLLRNDFPVDQSSMIIYH
jgi:hypothetical protein